MKTKTQNLKLIFLLLGVFFSLPSMAKDYGKTLEVTTQGQVLNATEFMHHEGAGTPDIITRVKVKNGVEFYVQLPINHQVFGITNGVLIGDQIKVSNAGTLRFEFNYNGTWYYVRSHVNYYGVLQYQGGDAPNEIGVVNSTDSRVGKEVNGVFYLSETESLFVPNHAFKDGMWWEGSLNKDNFVDLRDDQSTNQISLKEILERAESRVNGYTNSLNLRIQTNDGTSNWNHHNPYPISYDYRTIKDLRQPAPSLEVSPTLLSFHKNGGSQSVTVTSNQAWIISSNQAWVSVSPASGTNDGSFTVTVQSNASQQPRTATITVTVADLSKTISVNQVAAAPPQTYTISLSASPEVGGTVRADAS